MQHAVSLQLHNLNWRHALRQLHRFHAVFFNTLFCSSFALQRGNGYCEIALKIQPRGEQGHASSSAPENPRRVDPFTSVFSSKLYFFLWNWKMKQELYWIFYALNMRIQGPVTLGTFRHSFSNRHSIRQVPSPWPSTSRSDYIFLLSLLLLSP